jgi:twitching motility protein PilJ
VDDVLFKEYLDRIGNVSLLGDVTGELVSEMNNRKLEYVTLVGSDSRILAGANANRTGEYFDPSGVVSDVLANSRRIVVTTAMTNAEFRLEGAKRWLKPYYQTSLEGVLQSKLHPYDNNQTVLVRWTAAPVFAASNTNSSKPDGVIVYGDIINGKISFNELIVSEFDDGYAATFYYDSTASKFKILSSVRKSASGLVIDDEIPEAVEAVTKSFQTRSISIVEGTFTGESFELSGENFETSLFYACTNEAVPLLESAYNPPLYQVRATSNSHWILLRKRQLIIQVVTVFVQVLSTILISWVLFLPVYRFVQIMHQEFGDGKAKKVKVEPNAGTFQNVLAKFGVNANSVFTKSQVKESEMSSVAV